MKYPRYPFESSMLFLDKKKLASKIQPTKLAWLRALKRPDFSTP